MMRYEAVVIGASAGGIEALKLLLSELPASFVLPIAIVQHIHSSSDGFLATYLDSISPLHVKEAEDKEPMRPFHAYLAPPGYHLLIESDRSLSLSVDSRVNYSCPSIDVLFESAADAFASSLIGIILTGANADGAKGLRAIRARGGLAIVQNPASAAIHTMPQAAIVQAGADHICDLPQIPALLAQLTQRERAIHAQ